VTRQTTQYRLAMTGPGEPDPDFSPAPEGRAAEVRGVALVVRFALELALFFAVGWCAWTAAGDHWWRWLLAVAAPVAAGVMWGSWLSPRAPHRPPEPVRVLIEAVLFLGVGGWLWALGRPVPGAALAALWVLDRVVLAALRPRVQPVG